MEIVVTVVSKVLYFLTLIPESIVSISASLLLMALLAV